MVDVADRVDTDPAVARPYRGPRIDFGALERVYGVRVDCQLLVPVNGSVPFALAFIVCVAVFALAIDHPATEARKHGCV